VALQDTHQVLEVLQDTHQVLVALQDTHQVLEVLPDTHQVLEVLVVLQDTHQVLEDTHQVLEDTHQVLEDTHLVLEDTHQVLEVLPDTHQVLFQQDIRRQFLVVQLVALCLLLDTQVLCLLQATHHLQQELYFKILPSIALQSSLKLEVLLLLVILVHKVLWLRALPHQQWE
jgi:hypothetical protein